MIKRLSIPVSIFLLITISVAAFGETKATTVRVEKPSPDDLLGSVIVTVDGQERKIAENIWNAWIIQGGRAVVYSGTDGAGGYENEGQSLWRYDVATGSYSKLMTELFFIKKVVEAKSASGRMALLVTMTDGGLGAPHIAVVDPVRGQVWRQQTARFVGVRNGRIAVALYNNQDIARCPEPKPRKLIYRSMDDLLDLPASPQWPVGLPAPPSP